MIARRGMRIQIVILAFDSILLVRIRAFVPGDDLASPVHIAPATLFPRFCPQRLSLGVQNGHRGKITEEFRRTAELSRSNPIE